MQKRRVVKWVIALVVCVVVAAGSLAAVAYVLRQQLPPDEARFLELLQASDWRDETYEVAYGSMKAQVTMKDGNYAVRALVSGSEVNVIVKDSTVYFKPDSFESLYTAIGGSVAYQKLSPKLKTELASFEKRWIQVDLAMVKSQSPAIAKLHCGLALYEQLAAKSTDSWRELQALYKDQQFIEVKNVEAVGDAVAYTLALQPEEWKLFSEAYEDLPQYTALKRCNNVSFSDVSVPSDAIMKMTFDTKNNTVTELELQSGDNKNDIVRVRPSTDTPQSIVVPAVTVPYSEFVDGISTAVSPR